MPEGATPQLKPLKVAEYDSKQSRYKHIAECGKLPVRGCVLAPSSGGKTQLLANLILDVYRGCFERWYIFSPLCKPGLDTTWDEVRKYVYGEMATPEEEECFFWECLICARRCCVCLNAPRDRHTVRILCECECNPHSAA